MYLPGKLVPENIYDMPFEDFLKLLAMAEIARDLRIEDIEVGVRICGSTSRFTMKVKKMPGLLIGHLLI